MNTLNYNAQPSVPPFRIIAPTLWAGLLILAIGTGPLLIVVALAALGLTSDPNPNPVGFGIMAFFTFWPGIIVTVVGAIQSVFRWNKFRKP